jgi:prolyl oligopeptidase
MSTRMNRPCPVRRRTLAAAVSAMTLPAWAATPAAADTPADDFLWLEDVMGDRALNWVRERNKATEAELGARGDYPALKRDLLAVLNARDRIPGVSRRGDWLYNFWTDATNKRGLWRRTSLEEYRKAQPAWQTVLDLDELGRQEKENWVFKGAVALPTRPERCLLLLSRGGADAVVVREFDVETRRFVEGGFVLPEAKTDVDWLDADTLLVGTDFGPGSMTDSGYPRVIKRWKRGTPLSEATVVFEGQKTDVSAWATVDLTPGHERTWVGRSPDFYTTEAFLVRDGRLQKIDKPADATLAFHKEWALLTLRSALSQAGTTFPAGSLVVAKAADLLAGRARWRAVFTPSATVALSGYTWTRDRLLLNLLDNVAGRIEELTPSADGDWARRAVKAPHPGTLSLASLHDPMRRDDPLGDHYLVNYADYLTPDSLMLMRTGRDGQEVLKQRSRIFDATGMSVEQRFATSADGTRVPYFLVWPRGARRDAPNPTLLYGYGGFQVSMRPGYSGGWGKGWLERGGVLVVANIRGGGEFGPAWHQAAVKANKQRSYDDFIAVAEDLIRAGVTAPRHLGIMGGSNGGLLVGATFTQRPDLFNAVVCQVPLLDMKRYHTLLAGASWMAEYGNPDVPQEWSWISGYSPYQKVKAGTRYPRVLFTTSTRDDRVHPGHARKMAARMMAQGHPVLYYENIEGGHGGAADNEQRAHLLAMEYAYLWERLGRA